MRFDPRLLLAFALGLASAAAFTAHAQESTPPPTPAAPELMCRIFPTDLSASDGDPFRTGDGTDAVGQWVNAQAAQGWRVATADFETGVKSTGFPTAWTQICLQR